MPQVIFLPHAAAGTFDLDVVVMGDFEGALHSFEKALGIDLLLT